MVLQSRLLLAAIVLCGLALTLALPGDIPRWCRCRRTTHNFINPKHYKKLEILPPGAYCRETEIIITLKNKNTVCVAPEAKWIDKVIVFLKSNNNKNLNSTQIPSTDSTEQKLRAGDATPLAN